VIVLKMILESWNLKMWQKSTFAVILFLLLAGRPLLSQPADSLSDSTNLYSNIENYSEKSKLTKFLYRLVFKPVAPGSKSSKPKRLPAQKSYSTFEGKIIRKIHIQTLDPFGYSIGDTIVPSSSFLSETGNKLHIKTHPFIIRNFLLIKENQVFDSLLVKESERLVRANKFITDVSFYIKKCSPISDSIDIFIRELDSWSIVPDGSISGSRISVMLTDQNFAGLGHQFEIGNTWNTSNRKNAFTTGYYIPNYRNTYIRSSLVYSIDEQNNYDFIFAVDRPFFSPLAQWGAGILMMKHFRRDYFPEYDTLSGLQNNKFRLTDYWAGKATRILKGSSEVHRTTNLISTARFMRIRYIEKPLETDSLKPAYANEELYMVGVAISARRYVQDKYIFNFGLTEDVPVGKIFGITGGFQDRGNISRWYVGAKFSVGNYYSWGYLVSSLEFGTFARDSRIEQGAFTAGINYFSGLINIGNWRIRQFVKPQLTLGIHRFSQDYLSLNDGYGLPGFNSTGLSGTSRLLLTLQTQAYAPWNLIGFRFGPFFAISLGMLGNSADGFSKSRLFSEMGLGVLIKNLHLVINTFQVSVVFYPTIPGIGQNVIRTNSFKSTDFGFYDFVVGKPEIIEFR
jgi:hypothetical protein